MSTESQKVCDLCCRSMVFFSVGMCNHPICFECSARLRVLYKRFDCPFCRQKMPNVILTQDVMPFSEMPRPYFFDFENYISVLGNEVIEAYKRLKEHRCDLCKKVFATFEVLRVHMQDKHERYYCDVCVEDSKFFSGERQYYSQSDLEIHRRHGGPDKKFHEGHNVLPNLMSLDEFPSFERPPDSPAPDGADAVPTGMLLRLPKSMEEATGIVSENRIKFSSKSQPPRAASRNQQPPPREAFPPLLGRDSSSSASDPPTSSYKNWKPWAAVVQEGSQQAAISSLCSLLNTACSLKEAPTRSPESNEESGSSWTTVFKRRTKSKPRRGLSQMSGARPEEGTRARDIQWDFTSNESGTEPEVSAGRQTRTISTVHPSSGARNKVPSSSSSVNKVVPILRPTLATFIPPSNITELEVDFELMMVNLLGDDAGTTFLKDFASFTRGNVSATDYYVNCKTTLGDLFLDVFPQMLSFIPDIRKQEELRRALTNENPTENKLVRCPTCGQILKELNLETHISHHHHFN